MAPRNPSELTRLEEEREVLKNNLKSFLYRDKQTKAHLLRQLREVEEALGVESTAYNSSEF